MRLKPGSYVPELRNTIGDELLKVHVSYGPLIQKLLRRFNGGPAAPGSKARPTPKDRRGAGLTIKALAHITGGGFVDNIPRVLPRNCDVIIRKGTWEMPPIFKLIEAKGGVAQAELYQVFNMGIGMVLLIAADQTDAVMKCIREQGQRAWLIGQVAKGRGITRVT